MTRRTLTRLLVASALFRARAARLNWDAQVQNGIRLERRYRADAQVLLFGVPLLRRSGVGAGRVVWRESQLPEGVTLRNLEFAGFSLPEHAAGLNRLGLIRELSRLPASEAAESIYFGLMTASPEESADEARKALHSGAKEVIYTAIDGRVGPHGVETTAAQFTAASQLSAEHTAELEELAHKALSAAPAKPVEFDASGLLPLPFLATLARELIRPGPVTARYTYNARLYSLWLRKSPDAKAAAEFRGRGLLEAGRQVLRVAGGVRRVTGGKEETFQLWIEEGASQPLPLRIHYQPKSYLRLVFEAERP